MNVALVSTQRPSCLWVWAFAGARCPCVAGREERGQEQGDREDNLGRDQQLAPLQDPLLAKGGEDGLEQEMPGS